MPAMHTQWTLGAVGLAVLLACSPAPQADLPTMQLDQPMAASAVLENPPGDTPPGYADTWATTLADCSDPATAIVLTSHRIDIPAAKRSCATTALEEEHPTGRSMVYRVAAACSVNGAPSRDAFTFSFGASDTVMKLQINDAPPVTLERCPPPSVSP